MFYDALTLRAYVAEVVQRFPLPWFVQKLSQVGDHDFLLHFRLGPGRSFRWLLSLQPQQPSLKGWRGPKPQAQAPSSFVMQCRKHLQGRSLERVEVLYPERLVLLQGREHTLMLELLDRQPNLVLLTATGLVLGGFRLGATGERELRSRRPYVPPPQTGLPDARSLSPYQLEEIYLSDPPAWPQTLLKQTFGLSPAACQWLQRRFEGAAAPLEEGLASAWKDLWQYVEGNYSGCRVAGGKLSIWGEGAAVALLDLEEDSAPAPLPGLEMQRQRAAQFLHKAAHKLRQRLGKLAEDRARVAQADMLQREGELLLTYQHQVARGATRVELTDWDGQSRLQLVLDPALPVVVQAQKRLKKAAKYRRSLSVVEERVSQTEAEIGRLEETMFQVRQVESLADLEELMAQRVPQKKGHKVRLGGATGPRRYLFGDFLLLVGRSPRQNDDLVKRHSARDDLWFHVKDSPGAHVLLKTAGASPEPAVVEAAAVLAAHYSSRAAESKVLVSFTSAQRVKKPVGAAPGLVVYSEELTLWVNPSVMPAGLHRE
jgi:predicted ribosome quality control (RQC) complex YloA/Tae2 family protein